MIEPTWFLFLFVQRKINTFCNSELHIDKIRKCENLELLSLSQRTHAKFSKWTIRNIKLSFAQSTFLLLIKKTKEIEIIRFRKIHTVGNKKYQATIRLLFSNKRDVQCISRLRDEKSGELGKPIRANFFPLCAK